MGLTSLLSFNLSSCLLVIGSFPVLYQFVYVDYSGCRNTSLHINDGNFG